jgi:hypothetical protein
MSGYITSVIRDAFVVYGLTFAFGLGAAIVGFNMQGSPAITYLTNLLSGSIGFAIAGIKTSSARTEHLTWVAVTFWILNLMNIILGIQTYRAWAHSGVTIIIMAIMGSAFAAIQYPPYPPSKSTRSHRSPTQRE